MKKLDHHNMQISDERYIEKEFKNLRQKLNLPESEQILDQDQSIDLVTIYDNNDESISSSCAKLQ